MTIRGRGGAGLQRSAPGDAAGAASVTSALRKSREALVDIQGQLDALLAALREPGSVPDAGAPERLRSATRQAGSALAALGAVATR